MKRSLAAIVATFLAASAFLLAVSLAADAHPVGHHCHIDQCH